MKWRENEEKQGKCVLTFLISNSFAVETLSAHHVQVISCVYINVILFNEFLVILF